MAFFCNLHLLQHQLVLYPSHINIKRSIAQGRLIVKRSKLDAIMHVIVTVFFSCLAIGYMYVIITVYSRERIDSDNDIVVGYVIFPILLAALAYFVYRKLTESVLTKIETPLRKQPTQERLVTFLQDKGYEIFRQTKDVIIVHQEQLLSVNKWYIKEIVFIVTENAIYFNITKKHPKISLPVFFSHLFLKADLKQHFKDPLP